MHVASAEHVHMARTTAHWIGWRTHMVLEQGAKGSAPATKPDLKMTFSA